MLVILHRRHSMHIVVWFKYDNKPMPEDKSTHIEAWEKANAIPDGDKGEW